MEPALHACMMDTAEGAYGSAITDIWEEDGHFWAGNGEYYSQVNYCPVCGMQAPLPADPWTKPVPPEPIQGPPRPYYEKRPSTMADPLGEIGFYDMDGDS